MKRSLLLALATAVLAFPSCTTVVHPTETRTVYRTRTVPASTSTARVAPARIYDTPEDTTVVRAAE